MATGYRRRILIEPRPGLSVAELEDDYHHMRVSLRHENGIVTEVSSEMKRAPWSTCPGAMARLRNTFIGHPLAAFARRGEKHSNCTHLHDLARFAAAHAGGHEPVAYDIFVSDPVDGRREARLRRDGAPVLDWTMQDRHIVAPEPLAGRTLGDLGDWIATQDERGAEACRILRWAAIVAQGRGLAIPAGLSATAFPGGTCFTFQPDMARIGTRLAGADVDFSLPGAEPMADRARSFAQSSSDCAGSGI